MTNAGDKDKCQGMIYCGGGEQQMVITMTKKCNVGVGLLVAHSLVAYLLESCSLEACLLGAHSLVVPSLEVTSLMGVHSLMAPS